MKVFQEKITDNSIVDNFSIPFTPDIFFVFISPSYPETDECIKKLSDTYPDSLIMGCSTSGEIIGNQVFDSTIALTAVKFEKTALKLIEVSLEEHELDSYKAGSKVGSLLTKNDLRHIFVLSDGLVVNGAELAKGLQQAVDPSVSITGGLAGDGSDFKNTFVVYNNELASKKIVALGLYGDALKVSYGSSGGWDSFGLERLVTKSENNVLYELDGEPALALYKSFLGEKAKDLPGSGLLFPLSMRDKDNETPVVRTILGIDEAAQSLTFAGNIPQGSYVRLMKSNVDRLITGAEKSASICTEDPEQEHQLAFLISCVGRRLVMRQLVEEELEAVNDIFGDSIFATGFYSYGEIAPFNKDSEVVLHNQTMTITTLAE